jgi:hypothetical protein
MRCSVLWRLVGKSIDIAVMVIIGVLSIAGVVLLIVALNR